MADEAGEKTEQASGKKLSDARQKGQVAKSIEVNSAAILLFGLLTITIGGTVMMRQISSLTIVILRSAHTIQITSDSIHHYITLALFSLGTILLPILVVMLILGIAVNVMQVGFAFSWEAIEPNFNKINPLSGMKRMFFSQRSLVELLKGLVKLAIVGVIAYSAIEKLIEDAVVLMDSDPTAIFTFIMRSGFSVSIKIAIAYIVIAALDYMYQRFDFNKEQMMTKEEVKEENKMQEGDPLVKGHIRTMQRQMSRKRMMQDVPKADVIITNPTHFAIALKYEPENMTAPRVVAKGADLIAKKIKEIALEYSVPVVEDKPLARALYKAVEIGEQIPGDLFKAVAQILAYIYQMKNRK